MARLINAGVDYVTEGERRTAEVLATLPTTWVTIANKVLPTNQGRSHEIDFIVVGDRMVFVLDEKGWRGRIHGSDAVWVRADGSSERSPLGKVDYVAKVLAGDLRDQVNGFAGLPGHPVAGAVVLSAATERPIIQDPRAATGILLLDDVTSSLRERDAADDRPRLGQIQARIVERLYDLRHRPKTPKTIGPYGVRETLSTFAGERRFRAVHAEDPTGGERVLTVYPLSSGDTAQRSFFLTEFKALRQLRETGVVPEAFDPFEWSDEYLVIPSALPDGESLASLPRSSDEGGALREIELARRSFAALAKIHAAGVVHRALGPDAIYVRGGSERSVVLAGFHAARWGEQTIAPRLDEIGIDDPYAAPEITVVGSYGFASDQSDVYSLALVWLERIAGVPVARLRAPDHTIMVPEPEDGWPFLPQTTVEELCSFFAEALVPGPLAGMGQPGGRRPSAAECANRLEMIHRHAKSVSLEPGMVLDGRYEVVRVLGVGATARTILAKDLVADRLFALKQFLRPRGMETQGAARREFNVLVSSPHPHGLLPAVHDVYEPERDVHVKLEFIDGQRLTDVLDGYLGDLVACRALAADLLDAVEHLERHGLLHRDIKPDNVIVRERDGRPQAVLVDFGSAVSVGAKLGAAGTPNYLPPEAYFSTEPPATSDRYALAVLLLRAFTGKLPFVGGGTDLNQRPLRDEDLAALDAEQEAFVRTLLGAVALDPDRRPASASALREALFPPVIDLPSNEPTLPASVPDKIVALEERINPVVDQIRSLFRNSARGNADNRGLDSDFARETYVPTALDKQLLPRIFADRPRVVFLSGNPGDGKTAFLERFQAALQARNGHPADVDPSGWVWTLDGHTYRACYDASEAHGGRSADEQLLDRLAGLEGDAPPREDLTVLVAINDGRLADVIDRHRPTFGWLARETERAYRPGRPLETGGVWLVDLKRRAFVALRPVPESPSVMRRILGTLTAQERWAVCDGCVAKAVCPIRRNAAALGDIAGTPVTRLEHALLLSHLRQGRHLTIRDLRSGLAYLLTGDVGCAEIHQARHADRPLPAVEFWQTVFATDTSRDIMLGELKAMDPARSPQPLLERFLFFHRDPADSALRSRVFEDGADVPPDEDPTRWLSQVKRRLYFHGRKRGDPATEAPMVPWPTLLPYRHAGTFMEALADEEGLAGLPDLLANLLRGIGGSDSLSGPILTRGLCLKVAHSEVNRLTIMKLFPLEEFDLTVRVPPAGEVVEALPEALVLTHTPTHAHLMITLDVFEVLMRFFEGMEPAGPELQPLIEDLAPFKSRVLLSKTRELILVEPGSRMHLLTQDNGKVVRRSLETMDRSP